MDHELDVLVARIADARVARQQATDVASAANVARVAAENREETAQVELRKALRRRIDTTA